MSDATRWFVEGGIVYRLDPGEVPGRGYIAESDHLAALERVRVETLREARAALNLVYPVSDPWGHHTLPHIDRRDALAAIDRLIHATTTGDTE